MSQDRIRWIPGAVSLAFYSAHATTHVTGGEPENFLGMEISRVSG